LLLKDIIAASHKSYRKPIKTGRQERNKTAKYKAVESLTDLYGTETFFLIPIYFQSAPIHSAHHLKTYAMTCRRALSTPL
jgi:hypothetical protein